VRIADVRLNKEENAVMFVLISKEELHRKFLNSLIIYNE
jgi:hypothetical protein